MKVEKRDGITVLITEERLDALDGPKLKEVVTELAQEPGLKLLLDMSITRFVDSMGCGVLLSCLKAVTTNQGDMKIAGPTSRVLETLSVCRLNKVFQIYDSVESAVESFS